MNWEATAAIAELIGGVAVIVSLLYLANQVKRGTTIARAESQREASHSYEVCGTLLNPINRSIYTRALAGFVDLSKDEQLHFHMLMHPFVNQTQAVVQDYQSDLIRDDLYERWRGPLLSMLATTCGRQWWNVSRIMFAENFVEMIDRALASDEVVPISEAIPYFLPAVS